MKADSSKFVLAESAMDASKHLPFFEVARMLVCFNHAARVIENANHGIM
jgi:hypothetical protein